MNTNFVEYCTSPIQCLGRGVREMRKSLENALDAMFEPVKWMPVDTSCGGISSYSEVTAEGVQRVWHKLFSGTFNPKITLAFNSITFNTSSVSIFPDSQYVFIGIDEVNRRLVVKPTTEHDEIGLKIANVKNGKNVPRTCAAKHVCQFVFNLMKWEPGVRYRIPATFHDFGEPEFVIFDLDDSRQVNT